MAWWSTIERNVTNHPTPLRTDAYRQRPLPCSTTYTHRHRHTSICKEIGFIRFWLFISTVFLSLPLSLSPPAIRDLFHMRPCPIVATMARNGCWEKKREGGVRVIGQNNPIWWPSYYPAIGVQQRKGCRQKFNYLLDSVCFDNQLIIHPMSDAQSRCHHITDSLSLPIKNIKAELGKRGC